MATAPTEESVLLPPTEETLRDWHAQAKEALATHKSICAKCQSGAWCLSGHELERDALKLEEMAGAEQVSSKGVG